MHVAFQMEKKPEVQAHKKNEYGFIKFKRNIQWADAITSQMDTSTYSAHDLRT